jgi:hypothetical protein
MDYQLATPVSVSGDVNFFEISFQFLKPSYVDASRSRVTYEMTGPRRQLFDAEFLLHVRRYPRVADCSVW